MEDIELNIGRYVMNISASRNNIDYIYNIIRYKDNIYDLLIRAEKEIRADFTDNLFINFIKIEIIFGKVSINSIEFTYNDNIYIVYNFDEKILVEKIK